MAALAGCWPAAAQQRMASSAITLAAASAPVTQQASLRDASQVRLPKVAVTFNRPFQTSWVDSSYEFTMTPFVQDVQVPVLSVAGGRMQLSGYYRMVSAENFQMGLPGGGTLDAWSVSAQSHVAVLAPRMDQGAGFSVSLRLHGAGLREMHCHAYQTVNHAIAFIRGS